MSAYAVADVSATEAQPLRYALLRQPEVIGDLDPAAGHVAVYRGDLLVGTGSIHPEEMPGGPSQHTWRIHGIATEHGHRGLGVGALIIERCLAHAAANDGRIAWGRIPIEAFGFFSRHGFARSGDPTIGSHGPEYLAYAEVRPTSRSWAL